MLEKNNINVFFQSFHAEVHQYKHQIELFGQLTQRLIAVYRNDDTTRIKRATEAINHRYNELNNRLVENKLWILNNNTYNLQSVFIYTKSNCSQYHCSR